MPELRRLTDNLYEYGIWKIIRHQRREGTHYAATPLTISDLENDPLSDVLVASDLDRLLAVIDQIEKIYAPSGYVGRRWVRYTDEKIYCDECQKPVTHGWIHVVRKPGNRISLICRSCYEKLNGGKSDV